MGGEEGSYMGGILPKVHRSEICGIIWAGKEMLDSFWGRIGGTGWAVGGKRSVDGMEVNLEFRTIVGS